MISSQDRGAGRSSRGSSSSLQASRHAPENQNPNRQPIRPRPEPTAETDAISTIANADRLLKYIPQGKAHDAFAALLSLSRRLAREAAPNQPRDSTETTDPKNREIIETRTLQRIKNKIDTLLLYKQPTKQPAQSP